MRDAYVTFGAAAASTPHLCLRAKQHSISSFAWRSIVCLHLLTSHSGLDVPCPRASSDAVGGAVRPRAERRDATASRRTRRPARGASEKLKIGLRAN